MYLQNETQSGSPTTSYVVDRLFTDHSKRQNAKFEHEAESIRQAQLEEVQRQSEGPDARLVEQAERTGRHLRNPQEFL